MSDISHRTGPYLHAADGKRTLAFGERRFSLVLATAFDAGIIGTERNGIALIDENQGTTIFNELLRGASSYEQRRAFDAIAKIADWEAFTALIRGNANYKGGMADLDDPEPAKLDEAARLGTAMRLGEKPAPGPSILTPVQVAANADPQVPYDFPHASRSEIIVALAGHAKHQVDRYGPGYLAWDVKVHDVDWSGRAPGMEPDPAYDALWRNYAQSRGDGLFSQACEDGLSPYLDGEATSYPGEDGGDYKFEVGGRSGGWLHLTQFKGERFGFKSVSDLIERLCDLPDADLAQLYGAVVTFDKDIKPAAEVAFHVASERQRMEAEWKADPEAAEALARELGAVGWSAPAAAAPAP